MVWIFLNLFLRIDKYLFFDLTCWPLSILIKNFAIGFWLLIKMLSKVITFPFFFKTFFIRNISLLISASFRWCKIPSNKIWSNLGNFFKSYLEIFLQKNFQNEIILIAKKKFFFKVFFYSSKIDSDANFKKISSNEVWYRE